MTEGSAELEQWWGSWVHPTTLRPPDRMEANKIVNRIFLGTYETSACVMEALKAAGITHIMTVGTGMLPMFKNHFKYKMYNIQDADNVMISALFEETSDVISTWLAKRESNVVMVHCWAGVSRSSTIIIAYLIRQHGMSFISAMETVRMARHWIFPNASFAKQLISYASLCGTDHDARWTKEYLHCFEKLFTMHECHSITKEAHETVKQTYAKIFGEHHSFYNDVLTEMEGFVNKPSQNTEQIIITK